MVPGPRDQDGPTGTGRTIRCDSRARGGLGPDPSSRRGPASRPDARRRDHCDRAVHRPVDDPVRSRRLAGDVGDGRDRRPARGPALRHLAGRRPLDPGPVPAAGPLVEATRGARRSLRGASARGGRLHRAVPVQAPERQPAVPGPALPVPGPAHDRRPERHPRHLPQHAGLGAQHPVHAHRGREPPGRDVRRPDGPPHRARPASRSATWPGPRTGRAATTGTSGDRSLASSTRSRRSSTARSSTRSRSAWPPRTTRWSNRSPACARTRAGSCASRWSSPA